ncbi:Thioredoxin [Chishuiella changwenlii]|uniref:Thioredoxin n=1 Tax=Chishuiella changwenlii TaxID=1434701 RepID=A0A1M6T3W0_9FLAO|nr:thioredoxin family protein [Chishuiella changwenlii]GGE94809.1 thiol reductase thioredoxin [Chishuiella changwenlii]SHK51675.1 Thioredoxin [Chishuiella changwenlii]
MKKIITLSTMFFVSILFGQGIKFEKTTFNETLKKAKEENKLVFLDAYTTWCGPCRIMDENIFPLENIGNFYNSNFINLKIDAEKGEGIDIVKKYNISGYPTLLFINGNGEEIYRSHGGDNEEDFIKLGENALNPSNNLKLLKQKYDDGDRSSELLLKLGSSIYNTDIKLAEQIAKMYFEKHLGKKLLDDELHFLYKISYHSKSLVLIPILKDKKEEIDAEFGKGYTDNQIYEIKLKNAKDSSYNTESSSYDYTKLKSIYLGFMDEKDANLNIGRINLEETLNKKDYKTYEKLALEIYKDYSEVDPMELNQVSWMFYTYVSDKNSLNKAIEWANASLKKNENPSNTYIIANLYNKIGDKRNAKIWIIKSIDLIKVSGQEFPAAQKLLDSLN